MPEGLIVQSSQDHLKLGWHKRREAWSTRLLPSRQRLFPKVGKITRGKADNQHLTIRHLVLAQRRQHQKPRQLLFTSCASTRSLCPVLVFVLDGLRVLKVIGAACL